MGEEDKKSVDRKLSSLSRFGLRGRGAGPSRLPSLKPARDLTLGGAPKRTFSPNIVSRSTKKDTDVKTEDFTPGRRGKSRRERGRGGRGRGRGDIVASASIFSMGPAASQTLARALTGGDFFGSSGSRDRDDTSTSSRTVIKNMKGDKEDELDSDKVLEMLQEEGKIEMDENDVKAGSLMPITLPLASKLQQKIKQEDVKHESDLSQDEDEQSKVKISDNKKPTSTKSDESSLPDIDIAGLFKSEVQNGQLFFLQLPDTLPIQPLSHEDDIKPEPTNVKNTEEVDIEEQLKKFTFQNVSEGSIGKLQIHQSGKVTMRLGNVALNVSLGTPCGFLQDLVSIHTEKNPAEMICLGHVNHRLIAVPDYELLLGGSSHDDTDTDCDDDL